MQLSVNLRYAQKALPLEAPKTKPAPPPQNDLGKAPAALVFFAAPRFFLVPFFGATKKGTKVLSSIRYLPKSRVQYKKPRQKKHKTARKRLKKNKT